MSGTIIFILILMMARNKQSFQCENVYTYNDYGRSSHKTRITISSMCFDEYGNLHINEDCKDNKIVLKNNYNIK